MPARCAPAMSVSSRSPTTSGRVAPSRAAAAWNSPGSGLPTTTSARRSSAVRQHRHQGTVAGQRSARARQGPVGVGGDPVGARPHRDTRLGELRPADLRPVALHDRDRLVVGAGHRAQADARAPRSRSAARPRPAPGRPARSRSASSAAAAPAEVSTSSGAAATPMPRQQRGDLRRAAGGVVRRERHRLCPDSRSAATASTAPGIGRSIR